jgi:hypothetical protein
MCGWGESCLAGLYDDAEMGAELAGTTCNVFFSNVFFTGMNEYVSFVPVKRQKSKPERKPHTLALLS